MQGSRTACITQSLTHASGWPVRRFLHRMYVSPVGNYPIHAPELDLRCRKLGQRFPYMLYRLLSFQGMKISTCAAFLWSCGRSLATCLFRECSRSDFIVIDHPPLPFIRRMACARSVGVLRMLSGQISTAQWNSVMFYGYLNHETQPSCELNMSGNFAVVVCVHVGWSAVVPGFGLYFIFSIFEVYCDIGEKICQISIRHMYLVYFISLKLFLFDMLKKMGTSSRAISCPWSVCVTSYLDWGCFHGLLRLPKQNGFSNCLREPKS